MHGNVHPRLLQGILDFLDEEAFTAQRMQGLNPKLPVILATGYDAGDELARAGVSQVLTKPFRVAVLAREIRKALDS